MESIQEFLQRMAKQSNLIDENEAQDYILTQQEEVQVIENALEQKKKHMAYKLANAGFSEMEILSRISKVEWEKEIDRKDLLTAANSRKSHWVWEHNQRWAEKERQEKMHQESIAKREALKEEYSPLAMSNWAAKTCKQVFGKDLILNDHSFKFLTTLCVFLSERNSLDFIDGVDLNPKKGLLLRGVAGIGKTFLPTCLKDNPFNPIKIINILEISDCIKDDGEYDVKTQGKILYIDDVGTEETPIKHFGTDIHWFKNFIEMYYAKRFPFNRLMFSTNLNFEALTAKYGYRVTSRMKEMFNTINVEGSDFRKL